MKRMFSLDIGMIPLTGTTNQEHMRADLEVFRLQLTSNEIQLNSTTV